MGNAAKKIITIDDSKTMRDMVSFTLKGAGFDVLEAEDGQIGADMLKATKVDLIITDLNMPNMDGFGLIQSVRTNEGPNKHVPILVLTTESDATKKEKGKVAGATGWIVKPFNPEKLIQVVNKVCP